MNKEILLIAEQLNEVYDREPWFGRSIKEILSEIDEAIIFEKPNGQHSILELLWHMVTWKEFTISRLKNDQAFDSFEENDWRVLDHSDRSLWKQGLQRFEQLHEALVKIIRQQKDDILYQKVEGRNYDFRKLLYGINQHDIYHLGQIAYVNKMLRK